MTMVRYKAAEDYIYRKIVGEDLLIPSGRQVHEHNGIVVLNETGALLWQEIQTPKSLDELCRTITENYDTDNETASADAGEFLEYMLSLGAVETV